MNVWYRIGAAYVLGMVTVGMLGAVDAPSFLDPFTILVWYVTLFATEFWFGVSFERLERLVGELAFALSGVVALYAVDYAHYRYRRA